MSLLQEYNEHYEIIGQKKIEGISIYIEYIESLGFELFYSDIIYNRTEWEKFEKWYKEVYNNRYGKGARRNKAF